MNSLTEKLFLSAVVIPKMKDVLLKYIPEHSVDAIIGLIKSEKVLLKIVPQRNSKHGDYRKRPNGQHVITVNASLNPYKFLMTLVHELAHLIAIKHYGKHIQSHGKEWKFTFQQLMTPFIRPEIFPEPIIPLLLNHFKNPTASSDTDVHLSHALKKYNEDYEDTCFIHQIPNGSIFRIHNRKTFQKIGLKVKRYLCKDMSNGKLYLFNANAPIELLK